MSLTKERRDALPETDFAVPGKRKLPIHDATHVRLAHDMVNRTSGLNEGEKSEARQRILTKAKELGVDTSDWVISAGVSFEAMAIEMPVVEGHPNRMPFTGVLTRVDQPSDNPPGGSSGHRTLLSTAVAESALPSLLGMAVDYRPGFDGHDRKNKIGIITAAEVVGDDLKIEGFFYAKDFPEECERIRAEKDALGFSFEVDARIQDANADLWVIDSCVFTGAAVLYKNLAAYTTTSLAAQADKGLQMTPEELKAILDGALKPLAIQIEAQGKEIATIKASASLGGPVIDQVKPHVDALNACADSMEASGVGNDPKAGHAGVVRKIAAHMAAAAVSGNIPKIYRDHDYLPDARIEAGASAATDGKLADVSKQLETVAGAVADLGTKFVDLQAKAFTQSAAPARATITPEIKTLLAKAGIADADVADGKKLTAAQVDKQLDAMGLKGTAAIEAKLKLRHAGLMEHGKA